jgi:hypothetical protein
VSCGQYLSAAVFVGALGAIPSPVAAQVPEGVVALTVAWQLVNNTGHRLSDGFLRELGQSVTTSAQLEVEYGITDRLSANAGIPYVFARYTGALPSFSGPPVDECRCWHSAFQDFSLGARYRFGSNTWLVVPQVRFGQPSHDYAYRGEAVVGKQLSEVQVGVNAGVRVRGLSRALVQTSYSYAFVEKAIDEISVNRSNGSIDLGYAVNRKLYLRGTGIWNLTHGGLRFGSPTGNPFAPPGEINTPARFAERDRILRVKYWQVGAGASYSVGPADIFFLVTKYVWGRDAHNGQAYTVGSTWYFDVRR